MRFLIGLLLGVALGATIAALLTGSSGQALAAQWRARGGGGNAATGDA